MVALMVSGSLVVEGSNVSAVAVGSVVGLVVMLVLVGRLAVEVVGVLVIVES